jgi:uncharacterized membrane protein YhaH (DUF805 family)
MTDGGTEQGGAKGGSLWSLSGPIDRRSYTIAGGAVLLVQNVVIRLVATALYDDLWSVFDQYLTLYGLLESPFHEPVSGEVALSVAATSLPFTLLVIWLTVRRLNTFQVSRWWALLMVVPPTSLAVFLVLSVIPSTPRRQPRNAGDPPSDASLIPESAAGSAWFSVVATVPLAVLAAVVATQGLETYGWGLFVILPFWLGMASAILYGYRRDRTWAQSLGIGILANVMFGMLLLVLALEGLVCIIMAAPIGALLGAIGGITGYLLQSYFGLTKSIAAVVVLLAMVPFVMGIEGADSSEPAELLVESSVDIDAPPEVVWREVVAFDELPPPEDWLFSTGIAYPTHASIEGRGVGAIRRCEFSTGAFVEPITVWDKPKRLAFDVKRQPHPLEETSPWGAIEPPHLGSLFRSQRGAFRLHERAGGGTRLVGKTWYRQDIWPAAYWRSISSRIIHRIHMRVLRHIERVAEGAG